MALFTADDVLTRCTPARPDDSVTAHLDDSIQKALKLMLDNDFDQLPVVRGNVVGGVMTYNRS